MKFATAALLLSSSAAAKTQNLPKGTVDDVEQVFEGVLIGALEAEFPHVEHCITDSESFIKDFEAAYGHFKSEKVDDIIAGLKDVGMALLAIKNAMSDCEGIVGDFTKLGEMAVVFSNPESFAIHIGKDIIIHGHDIYNEVKGAVSAFDATPRDYRDFGLNIGKAAAQIILGEEGKLAVSHVRQRQLARVLQGILKNYGGHFDIDNLLSCIKDEGQAVLILDAAVQAFEKAWATKNLQDLIGGIVALVGFVQQFQAGLPVCEAIDTTTFDYGQLKDTIDIIANPVSHFQILENDVQMHGVSVLQDVHNGVHAYKHDEYELFGELMGRLLKIATQANYDKAHKLAEATDAAIAADKNMYLY